MKDQVSLERIVRRSGVADPAVARAALAVVHAQLRGHADASCLDKVSAALSGEGGAAEANPAGDIDALYRAVAEGSAMPLGEAAELCQTILGEIADAIGPDGRERLAASVPASWQAWLVPPSSAKAVDTTGGAGVPPQPGSVADHARGTNLSRAAPRREEVATGRTGHRDSLAVGNPRSDRPVSQADPDKP